jgi:hypothetical protein
MGRIKKAKANLKRFAFFIKSRIRQITQINTFFGIFIRVTAYIFKYNKVEYMKEVARHELRKKACDSHG